MDLCPEEKRVSSIDGYVNSCKKNRINSCYCYSFFVNAFPGQQLIQCAWVLQMTAMDAESVLKELESLQQLHVEQHQQLSLALSNSHALMQKFNTLTSGKKSVTIHSMPSQKSQRREDRRESFRSAKIQSRVQSVEQLGFAMVFGESARKNHHAPSIESQESIQKIEPSTMTGPRTGLGSQPSQPSMFPASRSQPFDLMPVPMVEDVNVPTELPGTLDPGASIDSSMVTSLHVVAVLQSEVEVEFFAVRILESAMFSYLAEKNDEHETNIKNERFVVEVLTVRSEGTRL